MKVVYIFESADAATYKLQEMILPQIEENRHGADVEMMFFFDDNCHVLRDGYELGSRLSNVARSNDIVLMMCDRCAEKRDLAERNEDATDSYQAINTYENVSVGCFPDVYEMAEERSVDQVITI
jgi:sulfur relay (sulfurtransferase) complex TusBCD TusD component (DsrE family)